MENGWLCPLYAFQCYSDDIQIGNNIKILKAPTELREHISQRTQHLYGLWEDPSHFEYAVYIQHTKLPMSDEKQILSGEEKTIKEMQKALEQQDIIADNLYDLITALRLCHVGFVHIGPLIFCQQRLSSWSLGGTTVWSRVSEKNFIIEDQYHFGRSNVEVIKRLLMKLQDLRKQGKLNVLQTALTRFHSSYTGQIENRIVDQMISFESLYLGDSQESRYKLAMRVAFLLGKENKKAIFDDMKKAYDARSKIVHGNEPPNRIELKPIVLRTGAYLRGSIKKIIVLLYNGKTLKDIKDNFLDDYVF